MLLSNLVTYYHSITYNIWKSFQFISIANFVKPCTLTVNNYTYNVSDAINIIFSVYSYIAPQQCLLSVLLYCLWYMYPYCGLCCCIFMVSRIPTSWLL